MDLITIYKKNNIEIKMFDFSIQYIEEFINTAKRLSSFEAEEHLSSVLKELSIKQDLKNKKITTTSRVPILHRGKVFDLVEQYKIFEDAVLLLSETFDLTKGKVSEDWKKNVSEYIKAHYFLTFQKKCDIIFFDEKISKVSLEIVLYDKNKIFLLPVILNEDDFYQKLF